MWLLRAYGVAHTIVWIPIIILVLTLGHTTPGTLAIILAGAFGPTALIALDCAVITYYSRQISPFWRDEELPVWVTNFGTALACIWTVYRHGASWGSLQYLGESLEDEAGRKVFGKALIARAASVSPDNVRQIQALVRRGNFFTAQTIIERAEARRERRSEQSQRQNKETTALHTESLLARAKRLGIDREVSTLLYQGEGSNLEAAEELIEETAEKRELQEVLDGLEERVSRTPQRFQSHLRLQLKRLGECVYPSREFRKELYILEKELAVAESARIWKNKRR